MTLDTNKQKSQPKPTTELDLQFMTTVPHISSEYMKESLKGKFRDYEYEFEDVLETYVVTVKDEATGESRDVEKQRIVRRYARDEDGNPKIRVKRDYFSSLELFTQDLRLGNMSKEESFYVRYNIDLCTDILTALPESFHKPALILLERSICVTETSQSKNGFLRRMFNTFFQHSSVKEDAPAKRSFFGLGKKNKGE